MINVVWFVVRAIGNCRQSIGLSPRSLRDRSDDCRPSLGDATDPLTAAEVVELLPAQTDGTLYDAHAVRSRLSEGAKAGLWLNPGKKGRANLYAVCTTHTP